MHVKTIVALGNSTQLTNRSLICTRRMFFSVGLNSLLFAGIIPELIHAGASPFHVKKEKSRPNQPRDSTRYERKFPIFGTVGSIILNHHSSKEASRAIDLVIKNLELVENILSLYLPTSEICRLNRDGSINNPHPYLLEVVHKARELSEMTEGAFDITVQPLWELKARARKTGIIPSETDLDAARSKVNWRNLEIHNDRIRLLKPGMAITLNALAQGFAVDRALSILRKNGIQNALINAGEIGAIGFKEEGKAWSLGIQHPRHPNAYASLVSLTDCCMATSGDYATSFDQKFTENHIFDPFTGKSPGELASVTVISPSCINADGLSTAIMVLGVEKGLNLLTKFAGTEALLITKKERMIATTKFPGS